MGEGWGMMAVLTSRVYLMLSILHALPNLLSTTTLRPPKESCSNVYYLYLSLFPVSL